MRLLVVAVLLISALAISARHNRHRRDHDMHDWLNEEQKNELKTMDRKSAEFKAKIREFYSQLSEDKKAKWNEFYRNHCWEWTKKVTDNIEHEEIIKLIADKQVDKLKEKINGLKGKLDEQHRSSFEAWENDCYELTERSNRKRRQIDADFNDFISWMSDEQKKQIGEMKSAGKLENEIHVKVKEYFSALDSAKQTELKNQFKGKCKDYFKPLMTDEEIEKIKSVKDDMKAAGELIKSVVDKQSGEDKTKAEKMFKICGQVYKESNRKRRDHDGHYNSFIGWMTDDQKKEIGEMKKSGKPEEDIHNKVKEFFGKLSEEKQKELKDEFKVKCRNFFIPLMNDEEKQKIKSVKGDKEAARALIEGIVNRQEGDRKKGAEKMFKICREVYKESSRRRREQIGTITRRDVRTKIEKHLAWLTDEQKAEIEQMSKVGAGKDDIRKKLFEFVAVHEKDPTLKEKTIKKCYEWMEKVASKEEIESLHQMHHTDHAGCKKKVREFIGRLPESEQGEVNSSLPFCEKLWYGDHEAHHDDSHHHHHHRRRRHRRHLQAIEKFLNWLEPEQLENLKELEASGVEFNEVMDKIKEYFHALDEDKKNELTGRLKNQCKRWAQEVSKPSDWEELKASYEKKDYAALREKLVELEDRLTENQKHIIEHLRGACYRVWDIKGVSRLRRSMSYFYTFVKPWMPEHFYKMFEKYDAARDNAKMTALIIHAYDELIGENKIFALEYLNNACITFTKTFFGKDKGSQMQYALDNNDGVEKILVDMSHFIKSQSYGYDVATASAMMDMCKHVNGIDEQKHKQHVRKLRKYTNWMPFDQMMSSIRMFNNQIYEGFFWRVAYVFETTVKDVERKESEKDHVHSYLVRGCISLGRVALGKELWSIFEKLIEEEDFHRAFRTVYEEIEKSKNWEFRVPGLKAYHYCRRAFETQRLSNFNTKSLTTIMFQFSEYVFRHIDEKNKEHLKDLIGSSFEDEYFIALQDYIYNNYSPKVTNMTLFACIRELRMRSLTIRPELDGNEVMHSRPFILDNCSLPEENIKLKHDFDQSFSPLVQTTEPVCQQALTAFCYYINGAKVAPRLHELEAYGGVAFSDLGYKWQFFDTLESLNDKCFINATEINKVWGHPQYERHHFNC